MRACLTHVVGAAVLLEALQRLTVARGLGERVAALLDTVLAAVEIVLARPVGALGALQVGLAGHQIGGAHRRRRGVELGLAGRATRCGGVVHLLLGAEPVLHGAGEGFLASSSARSRNARTRSRRNRNEGPVMVSYSAASPRTSIRLGRLSEPGAASTVLRSSVPATGMRGGRADRDGAHRTRVGTRGAGRRRRRRPRAGARGRRGSVPPPATAARVGVLAPRWAPRPAGAGTRRSPARSAIAASSSGSVPGW